jgi:hypothetical protein
MTALFVLVLGRFERPTDSGIGCPEQPRAVTFVIVRVADALVGAVAVKQRTQRRRLSRP